MSIGARRLSRGSLDALTVPAEPDGTNLLIGKVFSADIADSVTEPGNAIARITDQNTESRWISRNQSPVNIDVDLEGVYTLERIRIVWAADTIRNYALAVSDDGASWETIYMGETDGTLKQTVEYTTFTTIPKGRFLRITGQDRWESSYGNSIWEVAAYGTLDTEASVAIGVISNFRVVATTEGSISLAWAYHGAPLTGYTLQRDGASIASLNAGATSYVDSGRSAGATHNYTIAATYQAGGSTNTTNVTGTTTGGTLSGLSWLSGAGDDVHLNNADPSKFAAWRGSPVRYATIWTYPYGYSAKNQVAVGWFNDHNYSEVLNISSGWPDGSTWAQAASGGLDGYFTDIVDTLVAQWGNKKQVHLAFAYEFNGTWMKWSINGQVAQFGAAWKRLVNIVRARKGSRDIRIVLGFAGDPQAGAGATVDQMVQAAGVDYFDILGVNLYDAWFPNSSNGNIKTQSEWNAEFNLVKSQGPRGVGAWYSYAQSLGKPVCHSEWGLSDRRDRGTVDNPFWIEKMHEHFASVAPADPYNPAPGKLAGESYFNTWDQCRLWPSTKAPNAAARYKQLF